MAKSLLDLAYDYVSRSKGQVAFKDLWAYVVSEAGLDEETAAKKVSSFYTNLLLDGRFVTLGENRWDLSSRHTFDVVHKDKEMKLAYSAEDMEEEEDEAEEDEEEKEYNKVFEEPSEENDEDSEEEESEEEDEEEVR